MLKSISCFNMVKHNNPFYSNIMLPETYDGLCLEKLNNPAFEIETENNDELALDALDENKKLLKSKSPIKETKNNVEAILNNHHSNVNSDY